MSTPPPHAPPGASAASGPAPAVPTQGAFTPGRFARRTGPVTAAAYWRGWPEVRADLRASIGVVLALALTGIPSGLLWWALAPRADFMITDSGPEAVGTVSDELLVADDVVFVLVLAVVGLLAGVAAWFLRRRRGVATVLALAVGASLTGVVAWQVGEVLGAGPTEAQLTDVGAQVTTSLTLGSPPAVAVAPFLAILAYVVATLYAPADDLGRTASAPPPAAVPSPDEDDEPAAERPLVDVPPPGRPSA